MRGHKEQKVLRTWKTKFFRAFQHKQYGLARILLASFLGLFVVTLAVAILFSSYTGRNYLRYNSVSAFLANPEPDAEFTVNMGRTSEPYPRPLIPGLGMPNSAWSGGSQGMGGSSMASSGPEAGTQTLGMDCYLYNDKNACYQLCKDPSTIPTDKDIYCGKYDELAGIPSNCGLDQGKKVCNGDCRDASGGGRECWFDGQWAASLTIDSPDYQTNCLKYASKDACADLDTKCVNNKDAASCTLLSFLSCIGQGYTDSQCEEMQKNPTLSNPDSTKDSNNVPEGQNTDCQGRQSDQKGYGEGCSSESVTPRESPTAIAGPTGNCSIPSFYEATPMCFNQPVGKDCILNGKFVDCNDADYLKSSENNNSSTIVDPAAEGQRAQLEAECNRSDIGLNLVLAKICLAAGYTLPEGQPTAIAGPTGNCSIPSFYEATPMCFNQPVGKDCLLNGKFVDCNDADYLKSSQDISPSTTLVPEGQPDITAPSKSDNSVSDCSGFFAKIGCAVKSVVSGIGSAAQAVGGAVVKVGEAAVGKGWLWGTDPFNGWVKTCKEFPNVTDCVEAKSLALSSGKCEDPVYMNNPDYSYVCALEGGNGTGFSQSGDTGQSLRTDVTVGDPIRNYGETDKRDCLNDNQLACAKYCMTFPSDNICTSGISTKNPGTNENSGSTSNILNITFSPSAIYDSQGNFIGRIFFPGSPIRY